MNLDPQDAPLKVISCALKHGKTEAEIKAARRNPKAMRHRNYDIPAYISAAGVDSRGMPMEMIGAEQEDGAILIFHAMRLTKKMADELDLKSWEGGLR